MIEPFQMLGEIAPDLIAGLRGRFCVQSGPQRSGARARGELARHVRNRSRVWAVSRVASDSWHKVQSRRVAQASSCNVCDFPKGLVLKRRHAKKLVYNEKEPKGWGERCLRGCIGRPSWPFSTKRELLLVPQRFLLPCALPLCPRGLKRLNTEGTETLRVLCVKA